MDLLSWLMLAWIAMGTLVYFVLQTINNLWPQTRVSGSHGASGTPATSSFASSFASTTANDSQNLQNRFPETNHVFKSVSPSYSSNDDANNQLNNSSSSNNWINDTIRWLYLNYKGTPEFINSWIRSLNDASKKVSNAIGCDLVFEEIRTCDGAEPPNLSHLRSELGPRDHLTLKARIEVPKFSVYMVASQQAADGLRVTNYESIVSDLTGGVQVRVACIANELFIMGCFDGRPEFRIDSLTRDQLDPSRCVDRKLAEEALRKCFTAAVTNFRYNCASSLTSGRDIGQPVEEIFRKLNTSRLQNACGSNQLFIKVLRGHKLGGGEPVQQPYVIIEMDEPSQKHTTTLGLNLSPFWDEQFSFDLNEHTDEILFEVYDRVKGEDPKFLGLAIVGVKELRSAPSCVSVLTLQARPYQNDRVSGTLTIEFAFTDNGNANRLVGTWPRQMDTYRGVPDSEPLSVATKTVTELRPLSTKPLNDAHITTTKTTSVVMRAVTQSPSPGAQYETSLPSSVISSPSPVPSSVQNNYASLRPIDSLDTPLKQQLSVQTASFDKRSPSPTPHVNGLPPESSDEMSRGRSKERSFFNNLKRKLSLHRRGGKKRGSSLDTAMPQVSPGSATGDSLVMDAQERSVSTPPSRDQSETRYGKAAKQMNDSHSTGDISATSGDSVYVQSTLVIELMENSVLRYFLIPPNMANNAAAKRIMKKGKKLHIFNEHQFTAVRVKNAKICPVCRRTITRGFGKGAYECRDCKTVLHKHCHYRIDARCPNSTVSNLEMEYIWVTEQR